MANTLHVVQALYGDTCVLEYDNNGKSGFILVDGGPNKSYRYDRQRVVSDTTKNLFDLLTDLSKRTTGKLETINTAVVTHDDADHKDGIAELFYYLTNKKTKSPTMMSWSLGLDLMKAKKPPIENIWYNSQEGLTRTAQNALLMTPAEKKELFEKLLKDGFIDDKQLPELGWFGKFLLNYNIDLGGSSIYFNSGLVQPDQPTPNEQMFAVIGQHAKSKSITKGTITIDILGPHIPWSRDPLLALMDKVKGVSDWSAGGVIDARRNSVSVDLRSTATQDSAIRNKASIVFRANYIPKTGKKQGVLMLGDAPMSGNLKNQLFPASKDMEYAVVKIAHHGSAHNNFVSDLLVNPDISGELAWVNLSSGSLLQKAFLNFLTLRAPNYVISASTQFGSSPNPHISTILGIYLAAAARHMRYVFDGDVADSTKWKVEVYMTDVLAPNAKEEIAKFISTPEEYSDLIHSLEKFVIPGKEKTKVANYIMDYSSHMTIWRLKANQPYGSIGILDGSKGNDQWVEYKILNDAQASKRVFDKTRDTGTPNPGTSSRPSKKLRPSFQDL